MDDLAIQDSLQGCAATPNGPIQLINFYFPPAVNMIIYDFLLYL